MSKIPLGFILILLFTACKKDAETYDAPRNTLEVTGATSGTVNQSVSLAVRWTTISSCDTFKKFETSRLGNQYTIKVIGQETGQACLDVLGQQVTNYEFSSPVKGTFELRFFNYDKTYVVHIITIN